MRQVEIYRQGLVYVFVEAAKKLVPDHLIIKAGDRFDSDHEPKAEDAKRSEPRPDAGPGKVASPFVPAVSEKRRENEDVNDWPFYQRASSQEEKQDATF